eukprot:m.352869 g.352869  ORF g.352869 m.352869 type:complete len:259 (-) comp16627_c0_seq1:2036-2812(-)
MAQFQALDSSTPLGKAGLRELLPNQAYIQGAQWQLSGDASQILEIMMNPGQELTAEPGTMIHMAGGIVPDVHTAGGCGQACCRCCCAHESFFQVKYTNSTSGPQLIGLTPNFPGKVIPVDLAQFGGAITVKNRAFMAALSADFSYNFRFSGCLAGCCGGQGFVLNEITGTGMVFLNSSGAIVMRELAPGEQLIADESSVVAFQSTCDFGVRVAGNCCMCCCGGEGYFNTCITGPGMVILQSMPLEKMSRSLNSYVAGR